MLVKTFNCVDTVIKQKNTDWYFIDHVWILNCGSCTMSYSTNTCTDTHCVVLSSAL